MTGPARAHRNRKRHSTQVAEWAGSAFSPRLPRAMPVYSRAMKPKAYAAAGVDIDLGNRLKATLPQLLARTHRREVLGKVGGFGGLFALDLKEYREPVLVSSVDGVGTKL